MDIILFGCGVSGYEALCFLGEEKVWQTRTVFHGDEKLAEKCHYPLCQKQERYL